MGTPFFVYSDIRQSRQSSEPHHRAEHQGRYARRANMGTGL